MKRFRCGDVVPGCTAAFEGLETEILAEVAAHAARDHGLGPLPAEVLERVRAAMADV